MASSSSSSSETLNKCSSILVSNDLMQLIKDPEEEKEASLPKEALSLTTMEELLMRMKNYIVKHQLYDPINPLKIVVDKTELGSLFGKSEFSLFEVRGILQKFIFPVSEKNSSEVICSISDTMCVSKKRKLEDDSEFSVKRIKGVEDLSYESDESKYSFQEYETEFAKDTSDDDFSVSEFSVQCNSMIIAESVDYDVEYEIETDDGDFTCESESDLEDFVKSAIITFIAHSSDSDIEYLADGSSDETESEQELSEKDKWRCPSCSTLNDAFMRHCAACWETRVGWLCEKSERKNGSGDSESRQRTFARNKRKHSKKSYRNRNRDSLNRRLLDLSSSTEDILSSPSSSCKDSTEDSQSPSNSQESGKDGIQIELDKHLCLFCCAKPIDSSFIHGQVGCNVCCFKCGKKIYSNNKRCPICRRKIERIVYLYNS